MRIGRVTVCVLLWLVWIALVTKIAAQLQRKAAAIKVIGFSKLAQQVSQASRKRAVDYS